MVVEDMGLQVKLTTMALEKNGYDVVSARNGAEALSLLSDSRPDLILLDVEMPEMNGFQVLDRLRQDPETARIPVVMLTAHAKDAGLFSTWQQDRDQFMTKPFSPPALVKTVGDSLARAAA
jgi:CheY-like chemotaxis protein